MDITERLVDDAECPDSSVIRICRDDIHSSCMIKSKPCDDIASYGMDMYVGNGGKIIVINVKLIDVCPNKQLALAVMLYEIDDMGVLQPKGFRCMNVPAHTSGSSRDIEVCNICFAVADDAISGNSIISSCPERYVVKTVVNYVECPSMQIINDCI